MKVAIVGLGWLGTPLARRLNTHYKVVGSKRTLREQESSLIGIDIHTLTLPLMQPDPHFEDHAVSQSTLDGLFKYTDVLVITLPASRQPDILANYYQSVNTLIDLAIEYQIAQVIFTSSTSVYGDEPGNMTEATICSPVSGPGKVLIEVEKNLLQRLPHQVTILRLAGLAGFDRNPGRFFTNTTQRTNQINGAAGVNFVHGADVILAIEQLIEQYADGRYDPQYQSSIYNLCAPIHPSKIPFYADSALKLGLPAPNFAMEIPVLDGKAPKQFNRIIDGDLIIREIGFAYRYPNPYHFDYTVSF